MKSRKILFVLLFAFVILALGTTRSQASLYLNNLDFYAEITEDGNMNVTETWDINISETNTLYKTFELDNNKYSGISNVKVTEAGGQNLINTNTWAYHLTKNYYFAGINSDGDFEISWGVGLDSSSDTRTYKISYTVADAITKYGDCAELYWKFLGDNFEISAKRITGTVKLPEKADLKEDIRVWGHIESLNGEIYATDLDKVEFWVDNYSGGRFLEVRIAMPENLVKYARKNSNQNVIENIIEEETIWANEANARRQRNEFILKIIAIGVLTFGVGIFILLLKQTFKYIKVLKQTKKLKPTEEFEYFREKPNNTSTPADAVFLYNNGVSNNANFGNIFSSTLLNLSLKGYLKIEVEENEKGKEQVFISRTSKEMADLKFDENVIADFVKAPIRKDERITIKELQKYIKNRPEKVSKLIEKTEKASLQKNKENKNYCEQTAKEKDKYIGIAVAYFVLAMILIAILFPVSILLIVNAILALMINGKLSRLSQKGIDETEKWKGLKKYMMDFSLLNEKEIPALTVWEEYLVYATAFGIADKVIKQLKMVYPEITNMDNFNTASYVYLMSHTNFNSSFNNAISSSVASSAMSSGGGGGGGFSGGGGGGGGRWWRRWKITPHMSKKVN